MKHSQEDEAGELLWKYIEELKQSENADAINFIARTSLDPVEAAALLPLAEDLHRLEQSGRNAVTGEAAARRQLLATLGEMPPQLHNTSQWFGLVNVPRKMQLALLMLLLLLAAISIGFAVKNYNDAHCISVPHNPQSAVLKGSTIVCPDSPVRKTPHH